MNVRMSGTALAAALVLGLAAGPASPALAAAGTGAPATAGHGAQREATGQAPDAEALRTAVQGLPKDDATAALVRVSGSGGDWRGASGVHDLASGRPADPDGRFRAGSVTKVFTAAVVLQLAGEGRLGLDRPVRRYLPDLIPAAYEDVTVRQLLNHTSGIPSVGSGGGLDDAYAHRFDLRDPVRTVREATSREPDFVPGTQQHYANIGYTVAGLLIERVTGDTYASQVSRRVLEPLHLKDTYFPGTDPAIRGPHNHGYQLFGTGELRDVTVWGATDAWAAGDLISTTADLERFTRALFGGRVVRGPLLQEMFTLPDASVREYGTGKPAAYSAGLSVMRLGGREVWGKTGGRWGYNTAVAATRDLSRTLVYSVNSTDAKGEGMNPTALDIVVAAFGAPSAG
ncbi:beta-lactamase family protein [Streptomyces sp. NBC_00264]|uniref:serine hydrolase domain-containing protein n=1 Tax=unclassified Streptomyces TaxID=2593676 RepID=UPI002251091D|nr:MULTISPECIES: serine hydrolase domain-containing protein [unclassified Streptomyces]MCX5105508.1 beta-lactamase family protein [Streptomyces sp. NBC_00439]MCX5163345.1 beta-lactamase family protein [Streptomyces sp. NBC_00305]MCX5221869.1 beta-lactamase family protein [Streptomyces sp. NBC_00264]WSC27340.1 beta-lactamase family protein [Streptomyces sp. NBC_01768]